jgi:type 1 glutamine amidotransferase
MSSPKVLFLQGGWEGHHPAAVVAKFVSTLSGHGVECEVATSLEGLADPQWLRTFAAISPCWTMGQLTPEQSKGLQEAVRSGVGLGGVHGGMGDAFRGDLGYEWMVGGHFVGHPHVGEYTVCVKALGDPIMAGLPHEFAYRSEQYYMLVDPAISVLAEADYTHDDHTCVMPVVWTKPWGAGRVFYSALGHDPSEFDAFPQVFEMSVRGLLWAAGRL